MREVRGTCDHEHAMYDDSGRRQSDPQQGVWTVNSPSCLVPGGVMLPPSE